MDGNTRLCTATAAASLKASFGTDGQPGSYGDVDHCDALALWGHNVAETQTVLWMRMLDRRRGPNPPRLLVVDPRPTPVAKEADVHLAPRVGTNVALMNALIREIIEHGWFDEGYVQAHTIGFEHLSGSCRVTRSLGSQICVMSRSVTSERQRNSWECATGCSRRCCGLLSVEPGVERHVG